MAFGKAVAAESFALLEAAFGELLFIAAPHHAADYLLAEIVEGSDIAEGRHRPAQAVRFFGREIGCDHRKLHSLLMDLRDAEGVFETDVQPVYIVGRAAGSK